MMFSDMLIEAVTHRERNRREQNRKLMTGAIVGTAAGIAIGVVAGLLLAPKPGKETLEDLKRFAKNSGEEIREAGENLLNKFNETIGDARESLSKVKDKIKHEHSYFTAGSIEDESETEIGTPVVTSTMDQAAQQEPAQSPPDTEL